MTRLIERIRRDALLRHSLLLLAASQAGNASNLLFQWAMMRGLSDVEYGTMATLLSFSLVASSPLEALRVAIARQAVCAWAAGAGPAVLGRIIGRWAVVLGAAAVAIMFIALTFATPMSAAFSQGNPLLVVAAGALVALSLFMPLFAGALQGVEAFGWFAVSTQAFGVIRLVAAVVLVFGVSATAGSALGGQVFGIAISLGLGFVGWRIVRARVRSNERGGNLDARNVRAATSFFSRSLIAWVAFGVLLSADTPLAKLCLLPEDADVVARAAMLARAVVFLPMPIALAVFPKIAAQAADPSKRAALRRRSAIYAAGLTLGASGLAGLLGAVWWFFFTGRAPSDGELRLLRALLVAMMPLGFVYWQVHVLLALGRWKAASVIMPLATAYVGAGMLWCAGPMDIALALGACVWSALVALAIAGGGIRFLPFARERAKDAGSPSVARRGAAKRTDLRV